MSESSRPKHDRGSARAVGAAVGHDVGDDVGQSIVWFKNHRDASLDADATAVSNVLNTLTWFVTLNARCVSSAVLTAFVTPTTYDAVTLLSCSSLYAAVVGLNP